MKKFLSVCLALFLLLYFAGCAGMEIENKFKTRINTWTYDDMIQEMSPGWGNPTHVRDSMDRDIIDVVYDGVQHGASVVKTEYKSGDLFTNSTSIAQSVQPQNGPYYEFVFDKNKKVLRWYNYIMYYYNSDENENVMTAYIVGGDGSYQPKKGEKFSTEGQADTANQEKPAAAGSLEQKLQELKGLHDKNLITDEEYKKMREKAINDFK